MLLPLLSLVCAWPAQAEAVEPLVSREDEENMTSAGLDGLPPGSQGEQPLAACFGALTRAENLSALAQHRTREQAAASPAPAGLADQASLPPRPASPRPEGMARPAGAGGDKAMSEFEPVTYNYAQFYLVFALASMYIAMLMTGWGSGAEAKVGALRVPRTLGRPAGWATRCLPDPACRARPCGGLGGVAELPSNARVEGLAYSGPAGQKASLRPLRRP